MSNRLESSQLLKTANEAVREPAIVKRPDRQSISAPGVSVVICCHNSAARLPETLAHLSRQQLKGGVEAEVIVIDNASTDRTAEIARECWPHDCAIPLRVINEPKLGLSHGRARGFKESQYELVCFVDDDNWVCPDWIEVVAATMLKHPEVGACGGFIDSVCEAAPPWWFERYKSSYAPEAQGPPEGGDVTHQRFLMGAGLTIRKSAWEQIMNDGFNFLLVDRQGTQLTAGGDHEICHAICLAGWRLWYEPRLRLWHYLPAARLNWSLLRRQARGAGKCEAGLDPYRFALQELHGTKSGIPKLQELIKQSWHWQILLAIRYMAPHPLKLITSLYWLWEGDYHVIWLERQIGRLSGLLEKRKTYKLDFHRIRRAPWVNKAYGDAKG